MSHDPKIKQYAIATILLACVLNGCAEYSGVVRPASQLNVLSPELQNLTDAAIDIYLKADVKPAFPAVLAVARLVPRDYAYYRNSHPRGQGMASLQVDAIRGSEA